MKDRLKLIREYLASKAFADAIDLCIQSLETHPTDVSLLLLAASGYFGMGEYTAAVQYCEKVLDLDATNETAMTGILNAMEKSKNHAQYLKNILKFMKGYSSPCQPEKYFRLAKRAVDYLKRCSKFDEATEVYETVLFSKDAVQLHSHWSARPKRVELLQELDSLLDIKDNQLTKAKIAGQPKQNTKTDSPPVAAPRAPADIHAARKRLRLYEEIETALAEDHSSASLHSTGRYREKRLKLMYSLLQIPTLDMPTRKECVAKAASLSQEIIKSTKEHPFDEIYFEFRSDVSPNFDDLKGVVERFYGPKDFKSLQNSSVLMRCYRIYALIDSKECPAALESIAECKREIAQKRSLYLADYGNLDKCLVLLEGLANFGAGRLEASYGSLYPYREEIIRSGNVRLGLALVRSLNYKGLFDEALGVCSAYRGDPDMELEGGWQRFCMKDAAKALEVYGRFGTSSSSLHLCRLGRILLDAGSVEESRRCLLKSTELDPEFFEPHLYMGISYAGDLATAKECLLRSVRLEVENNERGVLLLADILMQEEDYSNTIALLKEFLAFHARSTNALERLAVSYYKLLDYNSSISTIHLYLRVDFRSAQMWELLGECYYLEGRYSASLKAFERAVELNPLFSYSLLFIAFINDKVGKYQEAARILRSLAGDPKVGRLALIAMLDVYFDMFFEKLNARLFGNAFGCLRECIDAISSGQCLEKLVGHFSFWRFLSQSIFCSQRHPQHSIIESLRQLVPLVGDSLELSFEYCNAKARSLCGEPKFAALLYSDLAKVTRKEEDFLRAVELDPLCDNYWNALGVFYFEQGRFSCSLCCYRNILERNPKFVPAWINLGYLYYDRCRLNEAATAFEGAQRLSPHHPLSWVGQYLANGSEECLLHSLEIVEEYFPELCFIAGKYFYGRFVCSRDEGLLSKAGVYFHHHLQGDLRSAECLNYLGLVCEIQRQFDLALDYFKRALGALAGDSPSRNIVLFNYARVCGSLGDYGEALEKYSSSSLVDASVYTKVSYGLSLFFVNAEKSLKVFGDCYEESRGLDGIGQFFVGLLSSSGNAPLAKRQCLSLYRANQTGGLLQTCILLAYICGDGDLLDALLEEAKCFAVTDRDLFVEMQAFLSRIYRLMEMEEAAFQCVYKALLVDSRASSLWDMIATRRRGPVYSMPNDKFNRRLWKSFLIESNYSPLALDSYSHFDGSLVRLIRAEQAMDLDVVRGFLEPGGRCYNLALKILFRSFDRETLLQACPNVPFQPVDMPTVVCVCNSLWRLGCPDVLSIVSGPKAPPLLYRVWWQPFGEDSLRQLSLYAKKSGGHNQASLLLQSLVHCCIGSDSKLATKAANKVLAVDPEDAAAKRILSMVENKAKRA